jgi:hypothetical protein
MSHSIFAPSSAEQWTTCSASVEAIQLAKSQGLITEEESSEYADEGTEAHDFADKVAKKQMSLHTIPRPMKDHIAGYLAETNELRNLRDPNIVGASHSYEHQVPLFYRPEDFGTVDFRAVRPNPEDPNFGIDILDFKYGQGVKVDAFENKQLAIYGYSTIRDIENSKDKLPDTMPVRLGIYQPRHHTFDGSVDWWSLTLGDLRKFCQEIEDAYHVANDPMEAVFKPSPKACLFCDIRKICKHRCKTSFQGMGPKANPFEEFDEEPEPLDLTQEPEETAITMTKKNQPTKFVTPEQVKWIVAHGKEMKKVIDDVLDAETDRIQKGGDLRGVKLVAGKQGNRTWVDEERAEKMASNYLNAEERSKPRQFKTAPQIIAALKPHLDPKDPDIKPLSTQAKIAFGFMEPKEGSKTEPLIHRPDGKPQLVLDDDPRPALGFKQPEDHFEAESDDEDWA